MEYLSKFRKEHAIDKNADLNDIKIAVECIREAYEIAYLHLANLNTTTDEERFINFTHLNLIGRIYEQVEGMLSCIATKSPTSSEALGRIVIEGSINLMYMSKIGNEKTLIAFFSSWVSEHSRKLDEWKNTAKNKDYYESIEPMINTRISVVEIYQDFVQQGMDKFLVEVDDFKTLWPKSIFKRFEALGEEESYYENYHRLSGSSHITAEDTITFLISMNFDDEQKLSLAKEAWAYSIMMSRLSCLFFIDALVFSCIHNKMDKNEKLERLMKLKNIIAKSAQEISMAAGVPQA